MKKNIEYALVKLDFDDDSTFEAICAGSRNIIIRLLDDATNTIGALKFYDLITGERISPDYEDYETRITGLSYSFHPTSISREEALDKVKEIRNNSEKLEEYVKHIKSVKQKSKSERNKKTDREEYYLVKLSSDKYGCHSLICTGKRRLHNIVVDKFLDTITDIALTDMVTGKKIRKNVFYKEETRGLSYIYSTEITREKALELLKELKSDDKKLQEYVDYVERESKRQSRKNNATRKLR